MNKRILRPATLSLTALFTAATASFAQEKPKDTTSAAMPVTAIAQPADAKVSAAPPSAADMQKMMGEMMELAKPGENHKLLASLDGTWNCNVKMWMDGDTSKKPDISKSTAVRKSIMDGRYFTMDVTGKMQMPGADGKPKEVSFKGMAVDGYDNVKKKFISTWCDNMGTGIMMSEGDYDAATKTLTYTGEFEMMPGMKQKIRETLKITDKDHLLFEWYEDRGGKEMKTMEIDYTRGKK